VRTSITAAVLLAWLVAAGASAADSWDQARVTDVARQLSKAVDVLYRKANVEQLDPKGLASRADVYVVVEDLQQLKRYSSRLARDLEGGAGREATLPLVERMLDLVDRLRAARARTPILLDAAPEIEHARELGTELTRLYGTRPLPPPISAPE
jgi:hypothetical protein